MILSSLRSTKLKPCPFCGEEELVECADHEPKLIGKALFQTRWIECLECGARGPYVHWDSFNNMDRYAEQDWNRRYENK